MREVCPATNTTWLIMAHRVEAIASRLEAIATRVEAIATRVVAIAFRNKGKRKGQWIVEHGSSWLLEEFP